MEEHEIQKKIQDLLICIGQIPDKSLPHGQEKDQKLRQESFANVERLLRQYRPLQDVVSGQAKNILMETGLKDLRQVDAYLDQKSATIAMNALERKKVHRIQRCWKAYQDNVVIIDQIERAVKSMSESDNVIVHTSEPLIRYIYLEPLDNNQLRRYVKDAYKQHIIGERFLSTYRRYHRAAMKYLESYIIGAMKVNIKSYLQHM